MKNLLDRIKTEKLSGSNLPEILTAIAEQLAENEKRQKLLTAKLVHNEQMLKLVVPLAEWAVAFLAEQARERAELDQRLGIYGEKIK